LESEWRTGLMARASNRAAAAAMPRDGGQGRPFLMPRWRNRFTMRLTTWSIYVLAAGFLLARGCVKRAGSPSLVKEAGNQELPLAFLGIKEVEVCAEVEKFFPGAMTGIDVMRKAHKALKNYGVNRDNTLYGQSVCSDEINGDRGHLPALMTEYYGRTFNLGSIGGLPHVGTTGFGAFSHHVPDNGNVLIVFGPHIGFSIDGEAGKFLRRGQAILSTAPDAVIAAYNQCVGGGYFVNHDQRDLQQCRLRQLLRDECKEVSEAANPMVALVYKTYKVVEQELLAIVNTDFGPGKLVLLGGIQINMPHPMRGRFLPLHFSIRSKTQAPIDLLKLVFEQ